MDGLSISGFVYEPASPELLASWHYMMRQSMAKANAAQKSWNERNAEIQDICQRKGWDKIQRATYQRDDAALKDHYALYSFYAGEVQRFGAMIQTELAMRTLVNSTWKRP